MRDSDKAEPCDMNESEGRPYMASGPPQTFGEQCPPSHHPDQLKAMATDCCGQRPTARAALHGEILCLQNRARGLQALLDALPARLPAEADRALREVLQGMRR